MITQLVIFGVLVVAIFGVGIALGMLTVPLFERLSEPDEEPDHDCPQEVHEDLLAVRGASSVPDEDGFRASC